PLAGCISTLIDGDGDGFAPEGLGACGAGTAGGDCVDTNPTVQPGAFDGCDGMSIDNDCDGQIDEDGTGRWYADCDGDGYAATGAEQRDACAEPESGPAACTGGGWTQAQPHAPNVDCNDNAAGTHPGATEIVANGQDENCDGLEVCYIDLDQDGYRTEQV